MVTQLFSKCWNIDVSLSLAICQPLHVYFPMSWIMLSTETGIPWIPWFFVNTTLTLILVLPCLALRNYSEQKYENDHLDKNLTSISLDP